ncbi:hypothetical protein BLNAU_5498 [Blattamonas nauphoetae]|uniref:Uncharacterized protein n=1 Tax=Blattamonas nauphoetae TaxID=2049346 RepID=A0ABQ9Y6X8_9EUKA|nr:hypothetical protein BLNAU_5498 [Blattamonas nauphoetae]
MECSPLIVCGDIAGHGSQIQIIRSTHISQSNVVLPLVGTCRNASGIDIGTQVMTDQTTNSDSHDKVSISGVGLLMTNQHFALGTGPLFTFHTGAVLENGMSVETSMLESTLVNVSSSSAFSPSEHLFGSEVSQRVVGSCVEKCTNHDSGTGMMSPNMGGNLVCLNTSFASCIRERNTKLEYSFENRTNTSTPARLNNVSSDVTSVSFTLCTFNEMTVAAGGGGGGSAIFIFEANSALTIQTCFFSKCTCTATDDDGGAAYFFCAGDNRHTFSASDSSCSECSTLSTWFAWNSGGSFCVVNASAVSMDKCFIEDCSALLDGGVYLFSDGITVSNTAFVGCSSTGRGGGLSLPVVLTLSLSFLQFRGCSSENEPQGKDIFFFYTGLTIKPDAIQFCDSTSGEPNVYFPEDEIFDSTLVPQISPTPTIVDVDVSFSGSEATVTVETNIAIKGTLGVLLNGSNVPRLVHVIFGEPTVVSKVGTAVVSCGSNGVLPIDTTYTEHKWTLAPFPRPTIHALVSAELEDSNSTKIVLSGVRFYEGEYWMIVEKDGNEWNISLTQSDSETLTGRAPLHPSTASERVEWSTEYEVAKVMWQLPDGVTEEEAVLTKTITFTTPDAPIRITAASCSLGGVEQKSALVTLTGVKLGGDKDFNITVRKMDGSTPSGSPIVLSGKLSGASSLTSHTLSVLIFGAASPSLSFETRYLITEFDVDGSVSVVDAGVTFDVPPEPPRITGVESRRLTNDLSKMIVVLEGRALDSRTGKVNLTDGTKTWESLSNVVIVDNTHCTAEFRVGNHEMTGQLKYGSSFTLQGMWSELIGFHVEDGVTVKVPHPPLITSITNPSAVSTPSFVLTVSGSDLPSGKTFEVTLTTGHTFEISFSSEATGRSGDIAIGGVGEISYGTGYTIKSIIRKVSGQEDEHILFPSTSFTTPLGPTLSLISCDLDLSNPNFVKVTLTTMNMPSEAFTLTLTTTETPIEIVELSLSSASISSGLIVVEVYNKTQTLKYGRSYSVSGMRSSSVIAVVSAPTFSTPDEPARIEACSNRQLNKDRTEMIIFLEGRALLSRTGKVNLTDGIKTWESLSNVVIVDNTHCTAEFGVGEAETVGLMKYGSSYTLKGMWTESSGFLVNDGITIVIPFPPSLSRIQSVFVDTRKTSCFVVVTGTDLIPGKKYELTLNTSITLNMTFTTSTEGTSNEVSIGESGILKYNTTYTITSLIPTNKDVGDILLEGPLSFTTGDNTIVDVIVSEGGSKSTDECGTYSTPCESIGIGWKKGTEQGGSEGAILRILDSARLGNRLMVGQKKLELRSLFQEEGRVEVEDVIREGKEEGAVVVGGGSLLMTQLTLRFPRPSLFGGTKTGSTVLVVGFGECVFIEVKIVESFWGEGVGMGMVMWSGGSVRLSKIEMKSIWMESEVSLVKCSSNTTEVTLEMSDCVFDEVESRNAALVEFSSTQPSSHFEMERCVFLSTHRNETRRGEDEGEGMGVVVVSTGQEQTEISKCVFFECGTQWSGSGGGKKGGVLLVSVWSSSRLDRKKVRIVDCVVMDSSPLKESEEERMRGGVVVWSSGKGVIVVDVGGSWFEETAVSKIGLERDGLGMPIVSEKRKIVHLVLPEMRAGLVVRGEGCVPLIMRCGSSFSGCSLRVETQKAKGAVQQNPDEL